MVWVVLTPLVAALLVPALQGRLGARVAYVAALVPAAGVAWLLTQVPGTPLEATLVAYPWVPDWGVALGFRLDGLSLTFALLINVIGTLILLYTAGYMAGDPKAGRLVSYLLLFQGAMLGVVLSDDLIALFVFWELTSIASYLLIGFKHEKAAARDSALQALLVTGAGALALLAGLVLIVFAGTALGLPPGEATRISALTQVDLTQHAFYPAIVILVALGAFTKSAQVPFHFWLPNAMTAPTPVSAYLHSATMVKAGVFLLMRLTPALGASALWDVLLTVVGAVTMLASALMAVGQTDLKRILAYTTVSVLGTLVMLIGIGTELAIKAAVVYLVAHASYKAALFMIAGSLEHATGTRDVQELGGLARHLPLTAVAGVLAALSMAGAPPLFGFIGKELLLKAKLDLPEVGPVLILVAVATNILLIAMALVVAVWPFFRRHDGAWPLVHHPSWSMVAGPLVLAVAGLFVGLVPGVFDTYLGSAMASAIAAQSIEMKLQLWHGMSRTALTALGISAVTLLLGIGLFIRMRVHIDRFVAAVAALGRRGPAAGYEATLQGLYRFAAWQDDRLQTGRLQQYVGIGLATLFVLLLYPVGMIAADWGPVGGPRVIWYEFLLVVITAAGMVGALRSTSRLAAIAMLGVTGLMIAVLFGNFSAPDLAMTQIMVETLTVILLVFIFYRLPAITLRRRGWLKAVHAGLALFGGLLMAVLVVVAGTARAPARVSAFFSRAAVEEAYGRNVVNVILVDFRGLDTLGEIVVVATAGLGVYALLRMRRRRPGAG